MKQARMRTVFALKSIDNGNLICLISNTVGIYFTISHKQQWDFSHFALIQVMYQIFCTRAFSAPWDSDISNFWLWDFQYLQLHASTSLSYIPYRLASPLLLQSYCWLLAWYRENSVHINHYIVKILHRIAVDLKLQAMLFQLSLFTTFRKVFSDPAASKYKVLVDGCLTRKGYKESA
jgi:hypothetical protein